MPLKLGDGSGTWAYKNALLDISGALTVSHLADPPNFYPLRSNDMNLVLADGKIKASGSLHHPASGTKITDVTISYPMDLTKQSPRALRCQLERTRELLFRIACHAQLEQHFSQ